MKKRFVLLVFFFILLILVGSLTLVCTYKKEYSRWLVSSSFEDGIWLIQRTKLKLANSLDVDDGYAAYLLALGYSNIRAYDEAYEYYSLAYNRKCQWADKATLDKLKELRDKGSGEGKK